MLKFLKEVFNHFKEGDTFQKGAALAYYTVFSLLPMIMIVTSILGILFGEKAVSGEIFNQLKDSLGIDASQQIQNFIKEQHKNHNNTLTAIIGFGTLAFSASGMFGQIHNAFNNLWNIQAKPKNSISHYVIKHIISFVILLSLFFIIIVSTTVNSFLHKYTHAIENSNQLFVYDHLSSIVLFSIIFAVMFKFLGDAIVYCKAALYGGFFTSILFAIGKIGIGVYIGKSQISTTFGSASALAILMLWVYYISQIIFLGASFVEVISRRLNCEIEPDNNAVKIEKVEIG